MNEDKNINRFKEQEVFKTPDGYFENFALKMQNRIVEEEDLKWYQKIFSSSVLRLAIPSLIVTILCFSIYTIISVQDLRSFTINSEDITNYILDENEYHIVDDFEQLLAVNLNLDQPSLSDDEIVDFLMDEEIELITQ